MTHAMRLFSTLPGKNSSPQFAFCAARHARSQWRWTLSGQGLRDPGRNRGESNVVAQTTAWTGRGCPFLPLPSPTAKTTTTRLPSLKVHCKSIWIRCFRLRPIRFPASFDRRSRPLTIDLVVLLAYVFQLMSMCVHVTCFLCSMLRASFD